MEQMDLRIKEIRKARLNKRPYYYSYENATSFQRALTRDVCGYFKLSDILYSQVIQVVVEPRGIVHRLVGQIIYIAAKDDTLYVFIKTKDSTYVLYVVRDNVFSAVLEIEFQQVVEEQTLHVEGLGSFTGSVHVEFITCFLISEGYLVISTRQNTSIYDLSDDVPTLIKTIEKSFKSVTIIDGILFGLDSTVAISCIPIYVAAQEHTDEFECVAVANRYNSIKWNNIIRLGKGLCCWTFKSTPQSGIYTFVLHVPENNDSFELDIRYGAVIHLENFVIVLSPNESMTSTVIICIRYSSMGFELVHQFYFPALCKNFNILMIKDCCIYCMGIIEPRTNPALLIIDLKNKTFIVFRDDTNYGTRITDSFQSLICGQHIISAGRTALTDIYTGLTDSLRPPVDIIIALRSAIRKKQLTLITAYLIIRLLSKYPQFVHYEDFSNNFFKSINNLV